MNVLLTLRKILRGLNKTQGQFIISVLCLAVSFAFFLFMMFWFNYELAYDAFYPDSKHIYLVNKLNKDRTDYTRVTQYPLAQKLKEDFPEVKSTTVCQPVRAKTLINKEGLEYETINAMKVDTNFFKLFPQRFLCGGVDESFKVGTSFIITESIARLIFGRTDVLGRHDGFPLDICGVITDPPKNTSIPFVALFPWGAVSESLSSNWGNSSYFTFVLLNEFASKDEFSNKLYNNFLNASLKERNTVFGIVPLSRVNGMSTGASFISAYSFQIIITGASFLLFFSAIFNFVMLTMVRFMSRLKEFSIYKIMGAGFFRIIFVQYFEILLLIFITLITSFILIELLQPFFFNFTDIIKNSRALFQMAILYAGFFILTVFIVYLYPILYICSLIIKNSLLRNSLFDKRVILNKGLIGIQLVIATLVFFFILGVMHQFYFLLKSDLGFNGENIERLELKSEVIRNNIEPFINELKTNNSIDDIIWCNWDLFGDGTSASFKSPEFFEPGYKGSVKDIWLTRYPLMPDVFRFFQMSIKEGRLYTDEREDGIEEIMVNEELVRQLGLTDAVGQIKYVAENPCIIVGVVKDIHNRPFNESIEPSVWLCTSKEKESLNNSKINICYFKYKKGQKRNSIAAVRDAYAKYAPNASQPNIVSFPDYIESYYQKEKQMLVFFCIITMVSLLISIGGVYTLVAFKVRRRRKEIVVRKILGASSRKVLGMLLAEYFWLVLISCCIAIPIGYKCLDYWMQYSYHVTIGIPHILIVVFAMIAIVFFTVIHQVVQLAYINPAEVIKENN